MKIHVLFKVIFILLLSPFITACQKTSPSFECTDPLGCVDIAPNESIRIGVLQALSGGATALGQTQLDTIGLAVEEQGQIHGYPIELQVEDSKCTAEGGIVAALKIVADPKIIGIVGTSCSGAGVTASKIMSEAGLSMISGSNSAPSLTSLAGKRGNDSHPGYFRTSPNNFWMSTVAASIFFQEFNITSAAIINDGDTYTRSLTGYFAVAFKQTGGKVLLATTVNKGDQNMRPVLEAVRASGAQFLFFALFHPEGDYLVSQARETTGLEKLTLLTSSAMLTDDFIKNIGDKGKGLYFIGPFLPDTSGHKDLLAKYRSKYGGSPKHGTTYPNGYDAAMLLLYAIEKTATVGENGTLHIGRQALRDTLSATKKLQGISGSLSCDEFGDCGIARYMLLRLDDPMAGVEGVKTNIIYIFVDGKWQATDSKGGK